MFMVQREKGEIWLSLCVIGCVRLARHFGKMYGYHLFSYGGWQIVQSVPYLTNRSKFTYESRIKYQFYTLLHNVF